LCEKRGINIREYPDIAFVDWPSWLVVSMMRWMWSTNKSMQRYTAHAASPGSMQETGIHYHAMLRTANELGMELPAMQSLEICLGQE
jgi:2-dehydropantoate 2-reductase